MNAAKSQRPYWQWLVVFPVGAALAYAVGRWSKAATVPGRRPEAPVGGAGSTRPPSASRAATAAAAARATGFLPQIEKLKRVDAVSLEMLRLRLRSGDVSESQVPAIFGEWCRREPKGAWEWWVAEGRRLYRDHDLSGTAIAAYFSSDPPAAMTELRKLRSQPAGDESRISVIGAVRGIVELLSTGDDTVAGKIGPYLNELAALAPSGMAFDQYQLTSENVSKVAQRIASLPPGAVRDGLLECIGERAAGSEGWLEWSTRLPAADRLKVEQGFLAHISRITDGDPKNAPLIAWAAERLAQPDAGALRGLYGFKIGRLLARDDPAAAWEWSTGHLSGQTLAAALGSTVKAVWEKDREQALGLVESLPPGSIRAKASADVLERWAGGQQSAVEAAEWARRQPPGSLNEESWRALAGSWASRFPENLRKVTQERPDLLPEAALEDVVPGLMWNKPEETLAWARALQPSMKGDLYGAALEAFSRKQPARAAALLEDSSAPPVSEDHSASVIEAFAEDDGPAAQAWAEKLPAGPLKQQVMEILGRGSGK